jgi:hypothetical protein
VGDDLFITPDLGVSWLPLDNPAPASVIGVDADGNLLAVTEQGVLRHADGTWETILPLTDMPITALRVFNEKLYALAGGQLYVQSGEVWAQVKLPEEDGAHFSAMTVQYPQTLWMLDSQGDRLWSTLDAQTWTITSVVQVAS